MIDMDDMDIHVQCTHEQTSLHVSIYVCMYVCVHIYIYAHVGIRASTHMCTHAYMCMCSYKNFRRAEAQSCWSERADPFALKERLRKPTWPMLQLRQRPLGNGNWTCLAALHQGLVRSVFVQSSFPAEIRNLRQYLRYDFSCMTICAPLALARPCSFRGA